MSIQISKTALLLENALNYRSMRQDMIASNIANADTPFYKPRDISFEKALIAKKADLLQDKQQLQMMLTDTKHIKPKIKTNSYKPTLFFRDGHMARNDGNSVDIDVETTEMSKNSIIYSALIGAMKKDSAIFRSVIEASQKIN